jgi:hypothetical protein
MRKRCFKCTRVLPIEDFYVHSQMADGRLGKCKECAKGDVHQNYIAKRPLKSIYERERNQRPERKAATRRYQIARRQRSPEKYKAHMAVNNAVRDGRLIRQPCRVCGGKAQGHHEDYSKPLEVEWLCFKHHREIGHGQVVVAA